MSESRGPLPDPEWPAAEERLMRPRPGIGTPVPAYHGRSLGNLASSLWATLARGGEEGSPPLPPLDSTVDPFHGKRAEGPVVLLIVDGLGWRAFTEFARRDPGSVAARWVPQSEPLTSVFPTTTAVVLTTLATGAAPAQHGVVGHRVFLPRFGTVVEVLRMSPIGVGPAETLVGPDWSPAMVSAVPSIYRRGVAGVALSEGRFEGTGFTRIIYDGATYVPYSTESDLALSLVEVLSRAEPPRLLVAYRDDLDLVQHLRGVRPELVELELERVDSILSFVARHLAPEVARRTRFLVTGDHGLVPMAADRQVVVDREPELLSLLSRPPSGDRRATFFAARPGRLAALREWLGTRLPMGGHLLEMNVAVEKGLFGPPPFHPELAERLGDLLLLLPSPGGTSYTTPGTRSRPHRMLAGHGGLEPEELLVPLVVGNLPELVPKPSRILHTSPGAPPAPKK